MASTSFNVRLAIRNPDSKLGQRAKDLSPYFEAVIAAWAAANRAKFEAGEGQEMGGVGFEGVEQVYWAPLTEKYYRQKHGPVKRGNRKIYPDWLMVETGDLMASLSSEDGFHEAVTPTAAAFGTPLKAEDAEKVIGNWYRRQSIFLSDGDKANVDSLLYQFLTGTGRFSDLPVPESYDSDGGGGGPEVDMEGLA